MSGNQYDASGCSIGLGLNDNERPRPESSQIMPNKQSIPEPSNPLHHDDRTLTSTSPISTAHNFATDIKCPSVDTLAGAA